MSPAGRFIATYILAVLSLLTIAGALARDPSTVPALAGCFAGIAGIIIAMDWAARRGAGDELGEPSDDHLRTPPAHPARGLPRLPRTLVGIMPAEPAKRAMSAEHKAALAEGREQGRAVRSYLEALEANRPKRGRKRTAETITKRLSRIEHELEGADAVRRLTLVQERLDLQDELETLGQESNLEEVEQAFIEAAAPYGARKGISYAAWREAGVSAAVLRQAGITRAT